MTTRMRSDVQGTEDMAVFYCDVCNHEWTANYVLECEKCGFLKMQAETIRLTKMVQYQQLYIQYLIGGITKTQFKKRAKAFAEPLDINEAIKKAKKEVDADHGIFEGANDIEGVILFLRSEIDKITKERDQAIEFLAMRMENLKENGKTILDFQAVWIQQANSRNNKLQIEVVQLEKKLSECEKFKQGYYEEALEGWKKVRDMEREAANTCIKKEGA